MFVFVLVADQLQQFGLRLQSAVFTSPRGPITVCFYDSYHLTLRDRFRENE